MLSGAVVSRYRYVCGYYPGSPDLDGGKHGTHGTKNSCYVGVFSEQFDMFHDTGMFHDMFVY
jgi:hypothetical protein